MRQWNSTILVNQSMPLGACVNLPTFVEAHEWIGRGFTLNRPTLSFESVISCVVRPVLQL